MNDPAPVLDPVGLADKPAIERARLLVILATVLINVAAVGALTRMAGSDWRTGLWLNLLDNAILLAFALIRRDRLILHLMLFGLLVGFVELPSDAWIVIVTQSLSYRVGGGPMLWKSPIWMPLAWEIVAVQFGYIGMRLWERYRVRGLLITGVVGAINIPYYEEMARRIHWWEYDGTAMFPHTHTPWAIIIGEFLIAIFIALLARRTRRLDWTQTSIAGVIAGASIFVGYILPYWAIRRFF